MNNRRIWNKLLDLLHCLVLSRCRTKTKAEQMMAQLEEIRREVYSHDD